jgi:hypothetical protein
VEAQQVTPGTVVDLSQLTPEQELEVYEKYATEHAEEIQEAIASDMYNELQEGGRNR